MQIKILCFSISLALLVSGSVFGATIKVPDDYATIQQAIDAAVDGDTVLVASGTYTGPIYFNGKKITVRSESGPNVTTIDGRVDFYGNETEESLLEGFTTWGSDIQASSPTIKNCRLKGEGTHSTGGHGSIYSGSSPTFIDCKIYEGQAGVGGGYDVRGDSSATFIDCEFSDNKADSNGGALYINNSSVSLEKCNFLQNSAGEEGGAISVTGSSTLSISFCNFSENSAQVGGGILNGYDDNTTISNSIFTKNTAEKWGGAIFANASTSFKTENCIFTENNANWHGGAIHINWSASPAITNSIFDGNIAGGGGGAIWIQPGSFSNITNCTFFKNNAGWRGGAILNSGSNPTISNSILWKDNAPEGPEIGEYKNSDPDPTVSHCDIQGGYPGVGNIDTDPLFIDPENGDFHLQYISPCIDSGTNDAPGLTLTDLDGKPRIINGNVDMGAYESELTKVNDYFSFEVDPSTYSFSSDTEGCHAGAVEKFSFDATLTNISEKELSNLFVEVDELTNNNLLLTNNGLIGEGGRFEVPKIDDYSDGYLTPDEYVDVPFTVCLQDKKPFRFFVNVLGIAEEIPKIPDPVSYWKFDEGSGNMAYDSVGNNNGTIYGADWTNGRDGKTLNFDGVDDYVEVPGPLSFSELTFSVWLKIPDVGINNNRIFTIDEGGGHYYALQGNSANALSLVIDGEEVNEYDWSFLTNTWTHIAMTYDGHTLKVYKDGVMTESGVIDGDPISGPLFIGGVPAPDSGAQIWDGEIDEIAIFDKILSDSEIEQLSKGYFGF